MNGRLQELERRAALPPSERWADIEDLVRRWARRFPREYRDNLKWVQQDKTEYDNERKDRPLRKGILIHPSLMVYIQQFYPTFMDSNKDVREFSRRFKGFVVDGGIMPTGK